VESKRRLGETAFALCLLPLLGFAFLLATAAPGGVDRTLLVQLLVLAVPAWWAAIALARSGLGELRVIPLHLAFQLEKQGD
jgi:hypothetical protein